MSQEPLFLEFVRRCCASEALRPETLEDLKSQSRFHAFRWAELRECAEEVLEVLSRAGVRPVLLKGIALVGSCYVPPHLRPMRDIDLLVRQEEIPAAQRALREYGCAPRSDVDPESYAGHHHLAPVFHPRTGVCLEVHHHIMRLPANFEGFPAIEELLLGLRDSTIFPGQAFTLDPTWQILTTCIHITHGDSIGRRAQNLIDLARIIECDSGEIDWDRLAHRDHATDVARSLTLPLEYLEREGLPSAPEPVRRALRRSSGLRSWELSLLMALIDRYRIGSPAPWRLVSGRISNILWRQTLRRGGTLSRCLATAGEILRR